MTLLTFELVTPERIVFTEDIYEAVIPTKLGQIAVLPGHIPLLTSLSPGILSLRRKQNDSDANLEHVAVSGGIAEILANKVRILADSALRSEEIDEIKAQEAHAKALALKETAQDEISMAEATALLDHSLAELKLARFLKHRKNPFQKSIRRETEEIIGEK